MNFFGILLPLLIMGAFYQHGSCMDDDGSYEYVLELLNVQSLSATNNLNGLFFESAHVAKFKSVDMYIIFSEDKQTLLMEVFKGNLFTSEMIEFTHFYKKELRFSYKRPENPESPESPDILVFFECSFSDDKENQKFFHSIYSRPLQEGMPMVQIDKMIRYNTWELVHHSELYLSVRDIGGFMNHESPLKAFYITHLQDMSNENIQDLAPLMKGNIDADFIFLSENFGVSSFYDDIIALCVEHIPNERFIIRFNNPSDAEKFYFNNLLTDATHERKIRCGLPNLSSEQMQYLKN